MTATIHALERANARVGAIIERPVLERIIRHAEHHARQCGSSESIAVRLFARAMVGTAWSDDSNGDTLVAIIRQGRIVTFMWRRRTQPFAPANLSVDRCIDAA